MSDKEQWQQVKSLPVQHDFKMKMDGEVYSRQWLMLPAAWLPTTFAVQETDLRALGPFYFRRLTALSRGLIRVEQGASHTCFRLLALPLLSFAALDLRHEATGGQLCYPIVGGWALARHAPPAGSLCMSLARLPEGVCIAMEVKGYYPRLMGRGRVWPARRWLYRHTQAMLHDAIACDFVRHVALALCKASLR